MTIFPHSSSNWLQETTDEIGLGVSVRDNNSKGQWVRMESVSNTNT